MVRIFCKSAAAVLLALGVVCPLSGADSFEDLQGVKMQQIRLPFYKDNRLQLLLFGDQAVKNGRIIQLTKPVVDMIRKDAGVDDVVFDKAAVQYALGAPFHEVLLFWLKKSYCEGCVFTENADVSQDSKEIFSADRIFLRTPMLDLDGNGFRANYQRRDMTVHGPVDFILRLNSSDPRNFIDLKSKKLKTIEKYEYAVGRGDSLFLDFDKGLIVLEGNVKITEQKNVITCDKLTIVLDKEKKDGKTAEKKSGTGPMGDAFSGGQGIKELICEGNAQVEQTGEADCRKACADTIIYDLAGKTVKMRGLRSLPKINKGEDFVSAQEIDINHEKETMSLRRDCAMQFSDPDSRNTPPSLINSDQVNLDLKNNTGVFDGNVAVNDSRLDLDCDRMQIELADKPGTAEKAVKKESDRAKLTGINAMSGSGKQLKTITCLQNVKLTRKDENGVAQASQNALADKAVFDYNTNIVTLSGEKPSLHYNGNSISGGELQIYLRDERIVATSGSRVSIIGNLNEKNAPGAKAVPDTVITSQSSDLNYKNDKLSFLGNVQMRDPRLNLDCDYADILLQPRHGVKQPEGKEKSKTLPAMHNLTGTDGGGSSGSKALKQIICTGNVLVYEPRAKMYSDKLRLFFIPVTPDRQASENAFYSNGNELEKLLADGSVRIESIPSENAGEKKSDGGRENGVGKMTGNLFGDSGSMRTKSTLTADNGEMNMLRNSAEFHGNVKLEEENGTLTCDDLYLLAQHESQVTAAQRDKAIDDDPFAGESEIPGKVDIAQNRSLSQLVADKNVQFMRKQPDGMQLRACGDKAVYTVSEKLMRMTGTPDKKPYMEEVNKLRSSGEEILYWPEKGEMMVSRETSADILSPDAFNRRK